MLLQLLNISATTPPRGTMSPPPGLLTWRAALSVRRRTMPTVSEQSPRCLGPRVLLVSCSACLSVTAYRLNLKRSSSSTFSDCRSHDQLIDTAHQPPTIGNKQRCYSTTDAYVCIPTSAHEVQEQAKSPPPATPAFRTFPRIKSPPAYRVSTEASNVRTRPKDALTSERK